jgi:hypothetical protein
MREKERKQRGEILNEDEGRERRQVLDGRRRKKVQNVL